MRREEENSMSFVSVLKWICMGLNGLSLPFVFSLSVVHNAQDMPVTLARILLEGSNFRPKYTLTYAALLEFL